MAYEPATARDYVADDFEMQGEEWDGDYQAEYSALANHLRSLAVDDSVCKALADWLRPFVDNDDRIDGTLYPDGDAMRFMVGHVPPHDPEHRYIYLRMFADCAHNDWSRWQALIERDGDRARWTCESGRPSVEFDRPHDEDPLAH
jgi:hypothetical protein